MIETSKDLATRLQRDRPRKFAAVVLNDNVTSKQFVQKILEKHFGHSTETAYALTEAVHNSGRAVAGIYTLEVAEHKCCRVMDEARAHQPPFPLELFCEEA